ncbi:PTPLA-domain-containing protein [Flagelloscypha sp. PMI_526]|nr:PTPLA-domain-containing protein [Flagelloscypha sp. PMI_526]
MAKANNATKGPAPPAKDTTAKSASVFKIYSRYYLIAYNVLSALGWLYILSLTITHLTNLDGSQSSVIPEKARAATSTFSRFLTSLPFLKSSPVLTTTAVESKVPHILRPFYRRATTAFDRVGWPVTLVQSFAVLEVLHVAAKLVKSSLPTTAIQVASRIYLTWGILLRFPSVQTDPLVASMVFAWSTTEVIRYSFYSLNQVGIEVPFLTYLRYTTFYVLYPLGAGSEAGLMFASLPTGFPWPLKSLSDAYTYLRLAFVIIWIPGLATMMIHMQKQRTKVLGPGLLYKSPKAKTA